MAEMGTKPDTMRLGGAVLQIINAEGCPYCGSLEASVDIEAERFHCVTCGARGDAIQLVFQMEPIFFYSIHQNLIERVKKLRRIRQTHCRE